ncbi:MAG: hypothetical protein A2014_05880 [Spirochaetes bacterium GWF1_49_6]|nr:MAG: hypothetical protein A2014_05880 [Spirochaetes bacterium GWF1_49_6]
MDILLAIILLLGGGAGGFFLGQATAPKVINNITEIHNINNNSAISMSAAIDVEDGGVHRFLVFQIDGLTNIQIMTVTNGQTNMLTNYTMSGVKKSGQ